MSVACLNRTKPVVVSSRRGSSPTGTTSTVVWHVSSDPRSRELDLGEVYRRYGGVVFRRILRFYDRQTAEEVLHEVFLKVMKTDASFRGESSVVTWLYQVTTRHCLNRLRNERRRTELLETYGDPGWGMGAQPAQQEAAMFLDQLWNQVDEDLMLIGVYHFVDGMPHHEIARVMGVSRRTVGNRLDALREKVRELGGGPE